jgi:hypothetical protein
MLRSRLYIFVDSEENEASAEFRLPLADPYKIWASSGFRVAPVPPGEGFRGAAIGRSSLGLTLPR